MKRIVVVTLALLLAFATLVSAQSTGINNQEVLRFVVPGSNVTGLRVHASTSVINLTLAHGALQFLGRTGFANLPVVPPDGTIIYCSNCTIANPCAAGGTGAFAKRINGVYVCN